LATPPGRRDLTQRAVVHVNDDATQRGDVDFQLIAPIDVVVDHRHWQQNIADVIAWSRQVKYGVHVFHRHDLRVTATSRPSYQSLARATLRGYKQPPFANAVQPYHLSSGRSRLTFATGVRLIAVTRISLPFCSDRVDERLADFCLVVARRKSPLPM
jgi:hypothetical protein